MFTEIIKKIILFISTILFSLFNISATSSKDKFIFKSDMYGPFPQYADDIDVKIDVMTSSASFYFCSFGFNIYSNDFTEALSSIETETYLITKSKYNDVSLTLQTKKYLNAKGEEIEFYVKMNSNIIYSIRFVLLPYLTGTIHPLHINERTFQANVFYFDSTLMLDKEEYIFESDIEYFHIDEYFRLNLYDIKFHYKTYTDASYVSSYLLIIDPPTFFSSLDKDEKGNISIPVSLLYDGEYITFALQSIYYVDPITLYMSSNPKDGYVETSYFYLPKNKKDLVNDLTFTFYINGFGPCSYDFKWNIQYNVEENLIGDCSDSDYCVVGDIS